MVDSGTGKMDAIVIGAGLSGLAAASLLAKRGLKVAVVEHTFKPGGSCGIFKRSGSIFDQGAAMMYGFGEKGFNSHRFLFNSIEEPIEIIRNDFLYDVYYMGKRIRFHRDIDEYINELMQVFPDQKQALLNFYGDMRRIYSDVMADVPNFTTPDTTDPKEALKQFIKHPVSYIKFLSLLNISAKTLLKHYFKDDGILSYFSKLTSTYCYTDVEQTPAILAAIMFVDNHVGGSYYPKGSTLFVPGKLEKSIEEHGGEMLYEKTVVRILIGDGAVRGVELDDGSQIQADTVIYSGTVWNLYGKLIDKDLVSKKKAAWASGIKASNPSVVLYTLVKKDAIPEGTAPITLFSNDTGSLDENEVTAYIFSIVEPGICPEDCHVVTAIGPTCLNWPEYFPGYQNSAEYKLLKSKEQERLLDLLEMKFPGFRERVLHKELATPLTIEKYAMKNSGSVAGPLQAMGQHMFRRLHTKSEFKGLYCCGESTVMGTGTPTVTVSGIAAANEVLKKKALKQFKYAPGMKDFVRQAEPHRQGKQIIPVGDAQGDELSKMAFRCEICDNPSCMEATVLDIRGINRRLSVGNFKGAVKLLRARRFTSEDIAEAQRRCILGAKGKPVEIVRIITQVSRMAGEQVSRQTHL